MTTQNHLQATDYRLPATVTRNACDRDSEGHCITCSDEALPVRVISVNDATGLALVEIVDRKSDAEEVDVSLVDAVAPGDLLLVHGGVALSNLGAEAR